MPPPKLSLKSFQDVAMRVLDATEKEAPGDLDLWSSGDLYTLPRLEDLCTNLAGLKGLLLATKGVTMGSTLNKKTNSQDFIRELKKPAADELNIHTTVVSYLVQSWTLFLSHELFEKDTIKRDDLFPLLIWMTRMQFQLMKRFPVAKLQEQRIRVTEGHAVANKVALELRMAYDETYDEDTLKTLKKILKKKHDLDLVKSPSKKIGQTPKEGSGK